MSNPAIQIEKTHDGYEVFGHRFSTRTAAEDYVWAEHASSKLRSEQFLWESMRDVNRSESGKQKTRNDNGQMLQAEIARRLDDVASRHRGWLIATVLVLAATVIGSFYLADIHTAGRWFFLSFFGWWFLLERNFWRCPACDVKLAPGLYSSGVTIRKIGSCPGCKVSLQGNHNDH